MERVIIYSNREAAALLGALDRGACCSTWIVGGDHLWSPEGVREARRRLAVRMAYKRERARAQAKGSPPPPRPPEMEPLRYQKTRRGRRRRKAKGPAAG
jgi:hypothetical protein